MAALIHESAKIVRGSIVQFIEGPRKTQGYFLVYHTINVRNSQGELLDQFVYLLGANGDKVVECFITSIELETVYDEEVHKTFIKELITNLPPDRAHRILRYKTFSFLTEKDKALLILSAC